MSATLAPDLLDPTATWVVLIGNAGRMIPFEATTKDVVSDIQDLAQLGLHTVMFASLPMGFIPLDEVFPLQPRVLHDRHDRRSVAELQRALRQAPPGGPGVDLDGYLSMLFEDLARTPGLPQGPLRLLLIDNLTHTHKAPQLDAVRRVARTRVVSLVAINMDQSTGPLPWGQDPSSFVSWCLPHIPRQWLEHPLVVQLRRLRKDARTGRDLNVRRQLDRLPQGRVVALAAAAQAPTLDILRSLLPTTDASTWGSALEAAAEVGQVEALDFLLPRVPSPVARANALKAAAGAGSLAAIERLLEEGLPPTDLAGALVSAIHQGHTAIAMRLLEASPPSSLPPAPLVAAVEKNSPEMVAAVAAVTNLRATVRPLARGWFRRRAARPDRPDGMVLDDFHEVDPSTADALMKALADAGLATAVFRLVLKDEDIRSRAAVLLLPHVSAGALRWASGFLARKKDESAFCREIEDELLRKTLPAAVSATPRARM